MTENPRRVVISRPTAAELFKKSVDLVDGIPDDATCEAIYTDHEHDSVVFIVSSEEFSAVPEGRVIPEITLEAREKDAMLAP